MARHTVTLIPGTASATRSAPRPAGSSTRPGDIEWEVHDAGLDSSRSTASRCLRTSWTPSARTGSPSKPSDHAGGQGMRSVNVALRRELEPLRPGPPCKSYPGVRSRYHDIDL